MAEGKRFELLVPCEITSFQDWLLKPLGHPSGSLVRQSPDEGGSFRDRHYYTGYPKKCQPFFRCFLKKIRRRKFPPPEYGL